MSVLAGPGRESLLFLIQNRSWSSLQEGSRHNVAVQLDGRSPHEFEAVAKTELDADGPGLIFAVSPGEAQGARFINELAGAAGMNVGRDGRQLEGTRLSGGGTAMARLAQCMSRMWGASVPALETATPASGGVSL
jgi:hypothetical protein